MFEGRKKGGICSEHKKRICLEKSMSRELQGAQANVQAPWPEGLKVTTHQTPKGRWGPWGCLLRWSAYLNHFLFIDQNGGGGCSDTPLEASKGNSTASDIRPQAEVNRFKVLGCQYPEKFQTFESGKPGLESLLHYSLAGEPGQDALGPWCLPLFIKEGSDLSHRMLERFIEMFAKVLKVHISLSRTSINGTPTISLPLCWKISTAALSSSQ